MKLTPIQHRLINMMQEIASNEGTDEQGAMRDMLTDLRHVSETYGVDFDKAVEGSGKVAEEESNIATDVLTT